MIQPATKKGTWCLWKQPYFCQESYQNCRDCPVYQEAARKVNEALNIAENMEEREINMMDYGALDAAADRMED